jgi:F-type H+-transporting ATPase subunit delta
VSSPRQIARRYAEALADSAEANNMLGAVGEELHAFAAFVAANQELGDVLASPAISTDNKAAVLDAILGRVTLSPVVANFLRVLLRNTRIQHLADVDREFATEVDRRTGVVMADVTTAKPLDDAERGVLSAKLTTMTGKKVKLTFSTDEALIGGVVTRIGSRIYDGSIRAKLDAVKRQMSGGVRA